MSEIKFVGLHAHSLSLGDSIGYPKEHFDFVLSNGGDGLAITDHGTAIGWGYLQQAKQAYKKKGIPFKGIFGAELYYHPDLDDWALTKALKQEEKESEDLVVEVESESKNIESQSKWADPLRRRHHLVVIVKDAEGYHNLCRIITESYRKGFYRFPRTDLKTLEKYNKGLIMSSACLHPDSVIETDQGLMTIREIVATVKCNQKILVKSFNIEADKVVFNKVTWGDCTRKNAKLLRIKLKDGKELKLTPDHQVFTDKGWIEARFLNRDHKILSL
jgi:DNA polymerase III alpha subunit